jgi:KDEL-tailed cysteine endopeptidase
MAERHEQWMSRSVWSQVFRRKREGINETFQDIQRKCRICRESQQRKDRNRTYKLSLNAFADLTTEEVPATRTGYKMVTNQSRSGKNASFRYESLSDHIPTSMDWRDQEAVTPIKDQLRPMTFHTYIFVGLIARFLSCLIHMQDVGFQRWQR